MSRPVNLNHVRKARARAEAKKRADANAAKHGRSKADRAQDETSAEVARRRLDAHRCDPDG